MSVKAAGTWYGEAGRAVRVNGQWRTATGIAAHIAGAWRQGPTYAAAFSASAPSEVDGYQQTSKPTYATVSASATITPSGGRSPYSYAWTKTGGDSRITISSTNSATATFSARLQNDEASASYHWIVTDANGSTATGDIFVDLVVEANF